MQCACAILSFVVCLALNYFPHYLIAGTIFEKKLLNVKCVFDFYNVYLKRFLFQEELSET